MGVAVVTTIAVPPIQSTPPRSNGLLIDLIIAAVITAVFIQWSLRYDWLAARPQFDDVSYFRWGLYRLVQLDRSFAALVTSLRVVPPHSPMADLLGMIAFAVFGIHDWAPAAIDGVLLLAALRIVRHFSISIPPAVRWSVFAVVVTLPMTGQMVVIFRPDFFYGLVLAAVLVHVSTRPVLGAGWARQAGLGAAGGVLLLIKPSVYPQTVALVGFAVLVRSLRDVFGPGRRVRPGTVLIGWGVVLAVAAAVAGPHYVIDFDNINQYIKDVVFSPRSRLWHLDQLTLVQRMMFYLTGAGGRAMLAGQVYVLAVLFVALGAVVLITATPARRWDIALLLLVLLATYLVPTINKTKSKYLGVGFQWTLVLTVICFADELFRGGRLQRLWASAAFVPAGLLSIYLSSCPRVQGPSQASAFAVRNATADALWAAVLRYDPPAGRPPVLGMTTMGPMINPDFFGFMSLKAHGRHMETGVYPYAGDSAEVTKTADTSDIVIASEPNTGETDETLESSANQARSLSMIRSRDDLTQVADVPAQGGGHFFVFVKRAALVASLPAFSGLTGSTLSPLEGPYPQYPDLPATRIGLGDFSELDFTAPAAGRYALLLNAESAAPGQSISVKLDGSAVRTFPLSADRFVRTLVWLESVPAGSHRVELDYAVHDTRSDRRKAVLFQSVRIVEASKLAAR